MRSLTDSSDLSAEYNTKPWQHKLSKQVSDALEERKDWIGVRWIKQNEPTYGREVKLLDYACGTGSITMALGPHVTTVRGIDVSENMVQRFNDTAQSSGLKFDQAHAVVGDLCGESVPDHLTTPEYYDFDIAAIGLGFHHFEDPQLAIKRLTERLKVGTGVLVIVDFLPFDGDKHGMGEMQRTIKHSGFSRSTMGDLYEQAGLEDFKFDVLNEPAVMELKEGTRERSIFIARGRKQPTTWYVF